MKRASQRKSAAEAKPKRTGPDEEFLRTARERFRLIQDAETKQRERELEDIRFYNGEQWPEEVLTARQGQRANGIMPAVAARPTITVNKAREPVRQVLNQERQSDLGVTIVPADDFEGITENPVNEKEIKLREGLVRRIQRTSDAAAARTWAFERAVIAGRGYYGVMVRFGLGKTWDREIYVDRIYHQESVSLGPHEQPDGSDADYGFIGTWVPGDEYEADFPKAKDGKKDNPRIGERDSDFLALGEEFPHWFKLEGKKNKTRMYRVVRYWYAEYSSRNLALMPDGSAIWESEIPDGMKAVDVRPVKERSIKCAKIDGTQILEETEWEGRYIPIIKVLGEELQPVNGELRSEGMVRPGIEPGRAFNVLVSKLVETIGHTPLQPLILDPESIEGWEKFYELAAVRAFPWLPQRTRGDDGREFREAHRPAVDPNLQPMALAISMFDQFIQSTMGVHAPSLGKSDPALRSSKMLETVVAQDAHGTSNFIDNLARSIHYEGLIENDLLYPILGKPGKRAVITDADGKSSPVMMHQPYTMQGGRPTPFMIPHPTQQGQQMPAPIGHEGLPPGVETNILTKDAQFNIAVKVTKNLDLKRDQLFQFVGQLVSANPAAMAEYGDIFWQSSDLPEHDQLAERAKIMLDPRILKALEAKAQGQDVPPAVAAQMSQMIKQIKELEAIGSSMQRKLDTDQVKADADLKKAQINKDRDIEIRHLELTQDSEERAKDRAAKIEETRISAAKQSADIAAEAREEAMALNTELSHDAALAASQAGHEADLSAQEHQQNIELAAQPPPIDPNAAPAEPAAAGA